MIRSGRDPIHQPNQGAMIAYCADTMVANLRPSPKRGHVRIPDKNNVRGKRVLTKGWQLEPFLSVVCLSGGLASANALRQSLLKVMQSAGRLGHEDRIKRHYF
jgi:hypothetical protein